MKSLQGKNTLNDIEILKIFYHDYKKLISSFDDDRVIQQQNFKKNLKKKNKII